MINNVPDSHSLCCLITDFGNRDHYVGVLKGIIKKINPAAEIIDINNEIPSYNIFSAAFALEQSYRFFPAGTVFLVVVDPGVGTDRAILLVQHEGCFFIAPDNGVLTPVLMQTEKTVLRLDQSQFFLIEGYSTFEARDKMAPVAAYLTAGVDPGQMGTPVSECIINDQYAPSYEPGKITARVIHIDKFGNIITNISRGYLQERLRDSGGVDFRAVFPSRELHCFREAYANGGEGPFLLFGSHGNLEVAADRASASEMLNIAVGLEFFLFLE